MKILIYIKLLLVSIKVKAKTTDEVIYDDIKISGRLSASAQEIYSKSSYITFYNTYNEEYPAAKEIIPININNGEFHLTIKPDNSYCYFALGNGRIRSITDDVFLIEEGDSVFMEVKDRDDISFFGKGAERMNFQHWAGEMIWKDNSLPDTSSSVLEIFGFYKTRQTKLSYSLLDSLQRIQNPEMDDITRKLLRLNVVSAINKQYMNYIEGGVRYTDSFYIKYLESELENIDAQAEMYAVTDSILLKN